MYSGDPRGGGGGELREVSGGVEASKLQRVRQGERGNGRGAGDGCVRLGTWRPGDL